MSRAAGEIDQEFDAVWEVKDGRIIERRDLHAPSLWDEQLDGPGWVLVDGYSGQDRYSGPIMHNSEYLGGRMAADVLAADGVYVLLVAYWSADADEIDDGAGNVEGWALARMVDA